MSPFWNKASLTGNRAGRRRRLSTHECGLKKRCLAGPRNAPEASDTALERPVTCIGRATDNDIVVAGEHAATVSSYHAEIRRDGDQYRLCDRDSTNGTYLNGRMISEAALEPDCVIRLGPNGPEYLFELRQPPQRRSRRNHRADRSADEGCVWRSDHPSSSGSNGHAPAGAGSITKRLSPKLWRKCARRGGGAKPIRPP